MSAGKRKFDLHLHCANCQRPSVKHVELPVGEGVPSTVDEFVDMLEYQPVPFICRHCDSTIGTLVAVTMEGEEPRAEPAVATA